MFHPKRLRLVDHNKSVSISVYHKIVVECCMMYGGTVDDVEYPKGTCSMTCSVTCSMSCI